MGISQKPKRRFIDVIFRVSKRVSEKRDFDGRKTGLFIPYWEADRFSDSMEQAPEHRAPVLIL